MQKAAEKNAPEQARKIYQPPVIIALGEMLRGKGRLCQDGSGAVDDGDCQPGTNEGLCFDGSNASYY